MRWELSNLVFITVLATGQAAGAQAIAPPRPDAFTSGTAIDDPAYSIRWQGADNRWSVSGAARLIEESRLNAAEFQTGGLFEAQAAVVRRYGDLQVGAVGYSARQTGEGVGPRQRLGPMRWTGSAVGPVVGYRTRVLGQSATVSLRAYREIDAPGENGDSVSAGLSFRF
jgi:hypothetical protein